MSVEELAKAITTVVDEYTAAGFKVACYFEDFPCFERPETLEDTNRFFEFRPSIPVEIQIFKEGALVLPLPPGLP